MRADRKKIFAVGFGPSVLEQLGEYCKSFELIQIGSMNQLLQIANENTPDTIDLVMVSTVDSDKFDHLDNIQSLRDIDGYEEMPVLSAISRYQMDLALELDRIDHSSWVIQPLEEDRLQDRLELLNV